MLTKRNLNDLWQAGFCKDLIETLKNVDSSEKRARLVYHHITDGCTTCRHANTSKALEHQTAKQLGPEAVLLFSRGGDITDLQGFQEALQRALQQHKGVDPHFAAWFEHTAETRGGCEYPYVGDHDDSAEVN